MQIDKINIDKLILSKHLVFHKQGLRDYVNIDFCRNVLSNVLEVVI